jgi:3-methyladenine DNA glycosylase AlkD
MGSAGVRRVAREVLAELRRAGDARRAAAMRVYFKRDEDVRFFGVGLPVVRRISADVARRFRDTWDPSAAIAFCDALIRRPELEAKSVGVVVLARWRRDFPDRLFVTARGWLAQGHAASWAAVDLLAPAVIAPLVERRPALLARLERWTGARSLWVRRAAVVALIPLARHGRALGQAYRVALALSGDSHDLIHKATGWLLREAGKTDMARLERFLRSRGTRLPRTTVRYAIERFPAGKRATLLRVTRTDERT